MTKVCAICGRGSAIRGKRKLLRGHYNLTKTERAYPNLQWARLITPIKLFSGKKAKTGQRIKACAKCLKTLTRI